MATFYENSLIHKGCHLPLWCCFGIVWNYSMYGNVDKVRSEILDYEFITNHNLRWNNVNQSGLLLNTSRFPSSATDLSLLNKPQKTPQTCSSSGFRFWNLSTLWHISLVTTASTYSTVCLWLRCIMVVYRATGEEIVELYRPDTGPLTVTKLNLWVTDDMAKARCLQAPTGAWEYLRVTSLRTQKTRNNKNMMLSSMCRSDLSVTHCETLHTIIISEDDDQVVIYSQKKKNVLEHCWY